VRRGKNSKVCTRGALTLGAKTGSLVTAVLVLASCGCSLLNGSIRDVPRGDWEKHRFGVFDYYVQADSASQNTVEEAVEKGADRLEWFWEKTAGYWDYPEEKGVDYYKFASRQEVERLTGRAVNGRAIPHKGIVHSIYFSDAHEVAHLFTMRGISEQEIRVGNFWLEGIAMYYTWPAMYAESGEELPYSEHLGAYQGLSVHERSRRLLQANDLPDLGPMIYGNSMFDAHEEAISYPVAGSFVTFLLAQDPSAADQPDGEAVESFKEFLSRINDADSREEVASAFTDIFEKDLEETEEQWREFLEGWNEDELG